MITFTQCAAFAGLCSNKIVLGVTPSTAHHSLLSSYLVNLWRGPKIVRDMIVADICWSVDLGAFKRAADLLIVLRRFLSDCPGARLGQRLSKPPPFPIIGTRCARCPYGDLRLHEAFNEDDLLLLIRRRPDRVVRWPKCLICSS